MKSELSKLELGSFSEQLQQAFQNNVLMQLQTPLTRALNQLDLNSVVSDLVKTELKPDSIEYQHTADRSQERTLENLASEGTRQLLQRFKDAEQANRHARGDSGKISRINQQLGGLETTVADIATNA